MRFTDRPKWKRIILAVICLIGLLAVAGGSFAAYTSQAFQRGVARNRDNETVRFTSNYLQSCGNNTGKDSYATRNISFTEAQKNESELTFELDIRNYINENANLVNQRDITYDLTISFSNGGADSYTVVDEDAKKSYANAKEYVISAKTLTGRGAKSHTYTIKFPGSDLDKLKITVTAVPQNLSVTNSQILAAVISPCVGTTADTFSYEGKFVYDASATPTAYDGFNYEISISSGEAEAVLEWNPAVLEIDKFFLSNNEFSVSSENGRNKINLIMNRAGGTGDYLIPFYIKDRSYITQHDNWSSMNSLITFEATQKQS